MIPKNFRPTLACAIEESDLDKLRYPVYVQPKLDGIRCICADGEALSRTLKPIPNKYIRDTLSICLHDYGILDGELVLKNKDATFQEIISAIMTEKGQPEFIYLIFDKYGKEVFEKRITQINTPFSNIQVLHIGATESSKDVLKWEEIILNQYYEGIIIRSPDAPYKFGRSTLKEQYLLKFKRFVDAEARIIGFIPRYENNNPLTYNSLGYAERSTRKENLIELPMLGAFQCVGINGQFKDISFKVSGLTDRQRYTIWENKEQYLNHIITYKYQKCGSMNKPRILTFKCFREDL